jgi:hypothetical protein
MATRATKRAEPVPGPSAVGSKETHGNWWIFLNYFLGYLSDFGEMCLIFSGFLCFFPDSTVRFFLELCVCLMCVGVGVGVFFFSKYETLCFLGDQ